MKGLFSGLKRTPQGLKDKQGKLWCECGDEIGKDGANGQCWVCLDITPNKRNKKTMTEEQKQLLANWQEKMKETKMNKCKNCSGIPKGIQVASNVDWKCEDPTCAALRHDCPSCPRKKKPQEGSSKEGKERKLCDCNQPKKGDLLTQCSE